MEETEFIPINHLLSDLDNNETTAHSDDDEINNLLNGL
jgi:hypothetical protein